MEAVNVGVGVGIYSETSTAVSAAAVLMGLEKAESTISCAPIFGALGVLGFARAAAETMQIRLKPSTPAPSTVRGPEYSRIFTLVTWPYQLVINVAYIRRGRGAFAHFASRKLDRSGIIMPQIPWIGLCLGMEETYQNQGIPAGCY
jgi:hypothetical protein